VPRKAKPNAQATRIYALSDAGMSTRQIAAGVGLDQSTIVRELQKRPPVSPTGRVANAAYGEVIAEYESWVESIMWAGIRGEASPADVEMLRQAEEVMRDNSIADRKYSELFKIAAQAEAKRDAISRSRQTSRISYPNTTRHHSDPHFDCMVPAVERV
jgi:hypothetical protein